MAKNQGIKKRLLQGIGANGLGQFITIFIQVVSVPIFLNFWGQELYGEWLILSATPMFLSMSDLGFTIAAENEMTMKVAKGDRKGALDVFQSVWFVLLIASFIAVFSIFFFFNLVNIQQFLSITILSNSESAYIIALLSCYVLLGMQISLLSGGFRCNGNYALGVCYANYLRFLDYLVITIAIYFGANPLIVSICFVSTRFIGIILMYRWLREKSSWISYGYKNVNFKVLKVLSKPAVACMGLPLINAMSNQGVIIIIGSLLTPTDVVVFSTLRTLSRFALQLMRMIRATISPEISAAYAVQNMVLARKLHRYSCKVSLWVSLVAVMGLLLFGNWLVRLWTNNTVEMNFVLFNFMLATIIFNSFWYTSFAILTATNQHQKIVPSYFLVVAFCLLATIILVPILGIIGASISLMIIDILMIFFVTKQSLKILGENFRDYFLDIVNPLTLKALVQTN